MTYSIKVHDDFKKDLVKLSQPIQDQLYKKLQKVQQNPHIPKNRLSGDLSSYIYNFVDFSTFPPFVRIPFIVEATLDAIVDNN